MQPKSIIRNTAYIVTTIWSVVVAANGVHLSSTTSKVLGFIPLALVLLFTLWDKYLWHVYPIVLISGLPDLRGTWLGKFDSQWLDDKYKPHETTQPVAITVKQTFTTLSIKLVAQQSQSYSTVAAVRHLESGEFQINYEYANKPFQPIRSKMPEHAGSSELLIATPRATKLRGEYWTNRFSRGTLDLTWTSKKRVSDLAAAQALAKQNRRGGA